ncbi:pentatricopeptide repeat-containing protein [Cucumis melo var. makuwa]|uniref:Pentatricopeptide repeat-containing protein n=1 Tax=Cucumis melo var. makuwa TaxID=1194695 RepID=A0A5A7VGH4_CUCMM|nr:pentatricopeptide repeat-containing protein [Cucumis melo var. makuwa]
MATPLDGFVSSNNASPRLPSFPKFHFDLYPNSSFSRNSMNVACRMHFNAVWARNRPNCQFSPIAIRTDCEGVNVPIPGSFVLFNHNSQVVKLNACRVDNLFGKKLTKFYVKDVKCVDGDSKVFDEIPERALPTYAALIRAYCRSEKWNELFAAFRSMVDEGILPDKYLVPTVLKACSRRQMVKTGKMVHGYAIRKRMVSDIVIGNALMDFYGNCRDLGSSINVFDSMSEKDVVSWTALVSAYIEEGLLNEAMKVFHSMQSSGLKPDLISWNALVSGFARYGETNTALTYLEAMQEEGLRPRVNSWNGVISGCVQNGYFKDALDVFINMLLFPENPNSVTVASILPACAGLRNLGLGRAVHAYALKCELCTNIYVEGSLVDMYSKCGQDDHAEEVFAKAEKKNVTLWNEIIATYVNQGKNSQALERFRSMQHHGLKPDVVTYNTLLAGYAKNGKKVEAYELLSDMLRENLVPNVISLNVLVSGFQNSGLSYEALELCQTMLCTGSLLNKVIAFPVIPDTVTITAALAACASLNLLHKGKEIHGYMLRNYFENNHFISSALINMYAKCENIDSAIQVFSRIKNRNVVCWNALIAGLLRIMQHEVAVELFCQMLVEGIKPSSATFSILLPALSERADLKVRRQLHSYIIKSQHLESRNDLANVLSSDNFDVGVLLHGI